MNINTTLYYPIFSVFLTIDELTYKIFLMEVYRRYQGDPPTGGQIEGWLGSPPKLILVDLSKKCNLWCEAHCGYPGQQLRREEKIAQGVGTDPNFINPNLLKQAFDEITTTWDPFKPVIQISADGEPLLHPKSREIISYPAKLGLRVGLTTNGILLTERLVEEFCRAGVNLINISLDAATPETYSKVRPERSGRFNFFQKVTENIRRAVKIKAKLAQEQPVNTGFMITMIQREESRGEEDQFVTLGEELGVDKVSFRPLNTTANLTPFAIENSRLIEKDDQGVVTAVDGVKRHPCHFPFTRFSLSFTDDESLQFVFCPHAWDRPDANVGRYPQDGTLRQLWQSSLLEEVRKSHLANRFSPDSICAGCPDWRFVTTREKQSYADILKTDG